MIDCFDEIETPDAHGGRLIKKWLKDKLYFFINQQFINVEQSYKYTKLKTVRHQRLLQFCCFPLAFFPFN